MKRTHPKLNLRTETLRTLSGLSLGRAVGGRINTQNNFTCPTDYMQCPQSDGCPDPSTIPTNCSACP